MLSRKGQNVKLASRLTHYKIEVKGLDEVNIDEYRGQYNNAMPEEDIEEKEENSDEESTNA